MKLAFTCLICLVVFAASAREYTTNSERKKIIVLLYDVHSQDHLIVHNKFGQVKVELWKRPEIQLTVRIRAHSVDQEVIDRYLNAVVIREQREGSQITINTAVEPQEELISSAISTSRDSVLNSLCYWKFQSKFSMNTYLNDKAAQNLFSREKYRYLSNENKP